MIKLTFKDLLEKNGIECKDVLLIRHVVDNNDQIKKCICKSMILEYTCYQINSNIVQNIIRHKYCAVFLSENGHNARFCLFCRNNDYNRLLNDIKKDSIARIPKDYPSDEHKIKDVYFLDLEEAEEQFIDYKDKLVIDWGDASIVWVQSCENNEKPIISISPKIQKLFPGYLELNVDFDELSNIIYDKDGTYQNYQYFLKLGKAIYLILDKRNNLLYVGSATGQDGILGRWKSYIVPPHDGGNKALKELLKNDCDEYRYFQFSILEILHDNITKENIVEKENNWKNKLGSKCNILEHGLNYN